jgi:hypothetical protein
VGFITLPDGRRFAIAVFIKSSTTTKALQERGGVGHLNRIWKPRNSEHFSTGAEIIYGKTRLRAVQPETPHASS